MEHIDLLIKNYPKLNTIRPEIEKALNILINTYKNNKKVLICGNGGSAADSSHIVGELMKSFVKKRHISDDFKNELYNIDEDFAKKYADDLELGLNTIDLTTILSLNTALLNDKNASIIYANATMNYGYLDDTLLAISTSGNSINIINAAIVAKAKKMNVISLSGNDGGKLKNYSDVSIIVPESETFRVQEYHLPIYHALCLELEDYFF
ncbi:MAG: SIS domain-containing protein [Eubacteriales bacterium]|nr:SIS domain-containing protein [Eubacteriales bacterium]